MKDGRNESEVGDGRAACIILLHTYMYSYCTVQVDALNSSEWYSLHSVAALSTCLPEKHLQEKAGEREKCTSAVSLLLLGPFWKRKRSRKKE